MGDYRIMLMPGDGVGPEVIAEGRKILAAVGQGFGHRFTFESALVGGAAIDAHGTALREGDLAAARECDAILFGAVGGPRWDNPAATVRPEQGLLALRKGLGLFANLRPVTMWPALAEASTLRPDVVSGVDLVVVRELTGGIYFGRPSERRTTADGREAIDTMTYYEHEIARVVRLACELARGRRKKVTSVDKANVLATSRLWREVAGEVARDFPDVTLEHALVDSTAMALIRHPRQFDVIVTENMFGDILTDEAAMLAGSMGMLPSASLNGRPPARPGSGGVQYGLYEPIHGSAPDIAGQGVANPLAMVLSAAMLLRLSLGLEREAAAVEAAVKRV
ncbi:MAG: 3-isopropylmalate dehydrogenase, partial [Chloroflexi bacterium]|nr:3-isopropylmalate dehydrogenase [Chloroflexota bacterium]